ncbi:MAG: choice-of-anchor P family protein [Marmoricola sp.]
MRRLVSLLSATALVATAGLAAVATPANAADPQIWTYSGTSGGTQVNALGTTISSGLTAASNLADTVVPNSATTVVAGAHVAGLLDVGAITSGQKAERFATPGTDGNGVKITSAVKIAGISLLGGAIKVDAIDSTSFATADSTTSGVKLDGGTSTTFVNLTIGGKSYPVNIPANTKITLGNLATIVINESRVDKSVPGKTVRTMGTALHITLLKPQGNAPAGAEIKLNPTQALVVPTGASDAKPVGGFAYGTYAAVGVGDQIQVLAQPTGMVMLPSQGTNDHPYTNTIAGVNIPQVAQVAAVSTTVNGKTIPGYADVNTGADLANINLLGGLIKADAINVSTHVRTAGTDNVSEAHMNFVNLVIAGRKIPINVAKNTQIYLFGVGQVWINQQLTTPGYAAIVGLRITLSTKKFGLPVGADIQVAVAASYVAGGGNTAP